MSTAEAPRASRIARRALLRVGGAVLVLWAVATFVFVVFQFIPGDPIDAILGPGTQASPAAIAHARAEYGLDQPLLVQYFAMLGRTFTLHWGESFSRRQPVAQVVAEQLPETVQLAIIALIVAWVLALLVALVSVMGGRFAWRVSAVLEVIAAALPHFWLAIALIVVFSTSLHLLPPVATRDPSSIILPALTLAIPLAGFLGQVMRESMLDAMESPFELSARARGESRLGLFGRHTLRHAVLPAVSLTGWAFGSLISGAVVVESVFARKGLGSTLLGAVTVRDMPLVIGILMVVALAYCLVTVAVDLAEALIDPRTRRAEVDA